MYETLFHLNLDPVAFEAAIENINKAIQRVEREWNQDASKFEYIAKRARFYIDAQNTTKRQRTWPLFAMRCRACQKN